MSFFPASLCVNFSGGYSSQRSLDLCTLKGSEYNDKMSALCLDECGVYHILTHYFLVAHMQVNTTTCLQETADCVINTHHSNIMEANVFKFLKMYRECEPFSETSSKLRATQEQTVLFVTDFRQRLECLNPKQKGIQSSGLGFGYRE